MLQQPQYNQSRHERRRRKQAERRRDWFNNRKSFCFQLLDGKELDSEAMKKLIFQVLKK